MNRNRLWLLLTILIGFTLRLTLLGEQSLWYDEGVTWLLSQMNSLADLVDWTAADIQPPLYYLLIWHTDTIFGQSEWSLRFPSAFFNTLTIPLIYVLARRLFPSRSLPLLAAVLFTISPLMVYYSQEARMYTLLLFEATLTSYLLLKILSPQPPNHLTSFQSQLPNHPTTQPPNLLIVATTPLLYALVAAAALYTHYFAAFLLAAHGLYTLFILWQRRWTKRLIWQTAMMFGLTALLFLPWLPTLLARLGDDPSYWPGALKLNEAVRKLLISFTPGETVLEQTGLWLAAGYLLIFLIAGLWAITHTWIKKSSHTQLDTDQPAKLQPSSFSIHHSPFTTPALRAGASVHNSILFLLLWLLIPPVLILFLSYQSPKFNPRYALLAWPAFLLLLAAALDSLLHLPETTPNITSKTLPVTAHISRITYHASRITYHASRITHHVPRLLFLLSLLFILATSTFSLSNWFTEPRFSKDDFQALAQFVRERIRPDETVLLSSGHLFPVWAYYYGWENWTPLPWMQRLDVNRVTDLSIAAEIAPAIEGKAGVWLVTWQDEVIDPNGVVPFWLDRLGERPDDAGDFWGVGLEHWRLKPTKIKLLDQDPIDRPLAVNFGGQLDLVGLTQLSDTDLALFWQARQPLPETVILTLDLTDKEGFSWDRASIVEQIGSHYYPPSRWPVGQTVLTRHHLPWQIGTPPGLYLAEIGLGQVEEEGTETFTGWDVLDKQGRPQRRTALVESVNLSQLVEPEAGPLPLDDDPLVDFLPIVAVRRSILPQESAEPGDRLLLALLWQAGEFNLDDISVAFDLVDSASQSFRVGASLTPSRRYNLPRWDPGAVVLGQYWLDIPVEAAPGPATLQLHLVTIGASGYDEIFPFDRLEIVPTERTFTPPASVDMPLEAGFSGQISLIGASCRPADSSHDPESSCVAAPGQPVTLTLYWRAETQPDKNLTVFTHLLGPAETVLLNADHAPPKPTKGWVTGEIIADPVTLAIPADLPPGDYPIEVGLYDAADPAFTRLPLDNGETRLILPQPLIVK